MFDAKLLKVISSAHAISVYKSRTYELSRSLVIFVIFLVFLDLFTVFPQVGAYKVV